MTANILKQDPKQKVDDVSLFKRRKVFRKADCFHWNNVSWLLLLVWHEIVVMWPGHMTWHTSFAAIFMTMLPVLSSIQAGNKPEPLTQRCFVYAL